MPGPGRETEHAGAKASGSLGARVRGRGKGRGRGTGRGEQVPVGLLTREEPSLGLDQGHLLGPGVYEQRMLVSLMFINTSRYLVEMVTRRFWCISTSFVI